MGMLTQNSKMRKSGIFGFGLTPGMTCQNCRVKCYAVRGMYNVHAKNCAKHWDENLAATLDDTFVTRMIKAISNKRNVTHIRVHTEGDFYSQEYLNKWARIARYFKRVNPDIKFYAYTKALHLDFSSLPINFKIIQSIGGEYDDKIDYTKPHARIFATWQECYDHEYHNCSDDDLLAANPDTIKVGLIEH